MRDSPSAPSPYSDNPKAENILRRTSRWTRSDSRVDNEIREMTLTPTPSSRPHVTCWTLVSSKRIGAAGPRDSVSCPTSALMTVAHFPNHPYFSPPGAFRPRTDGTSTVLGTTDRLSIKFSSYANKLPAIKCDPVLPIPPLNQAFKDKVHRALYALPTSDKIVTFNQTRLPGPAGTSAVLYLLPRREPAGA